jgi:hypothetical protein
MRRRARGAGACTGSSDLVPCCRGYVNGSSVAYRGPTTRGMFDGGSTSRLAARRRSEAWAAGSPSARSFPTHEVGSQRSSTDLEGDQSPWKERVMRHRQRCRIITDSSAEQGPEGDRSVAVALAVMLGNGLRGRRRMPRCRGTLGCSRSPHRPSGRGGDDRQRQEGNGRSDAVRLPTRETLRRVRSALRGPGRCALTSGQACARHKRSESHGRKRGATDPRPCWSETAEVVRDHEGGAR